jgi:uncharacterized membrane protein YidH (DUF202 family)
MKTSDVEYNGTARFRSLVEWGLLHEEELEEADAAASYRDVELEWVLRYEFDIPRRKMLEALCEYYHCAWVEYDERRPVPPDLLMGLDGSQLCYSQWFPVIRDGEAVVIAACNPRDPEVIEEVQQAIEAPRYEFRVALAEDILSYIQDFMNSSPEHLVGNERTGLAYWRNTLARWRTRLACYRTDFAMARTYFSIFRGGLGMIGLGRTLLSAPKFGPHYSVYWGMIGVGFCAVVLGAISYFRIKKSVISPPKHETLIEVTGATLYFLENYQFVESRPKESPAKKTMLGRLADLLPSSCVYIEPSFDNKVRSSLAHERTSLAAQRTVAACYRTIYSRARTGLSFIRTGVSLAGIGIGFVGYFGFSWLNALDYFFMLCGLLMMIDGTVWYWPVRREYCEASRCAVIA